MSDTKPWAWALKDKNDGEVEVYESEESASMWQKMGRDAGFEEEIVPLYPAPPQVAKLEAENSQLRAAARRLLKRSHQH